MNKRIAMALVAGCLLAPLVSALEIGGPAPELMIAKTIKGQELKGSLKDSGTIHVVEFWATWCGPCLQSIPHLTELQKKYQDKKVRIVGISDEDEQQVQGFVDSKGDEMDYTVALDLDKKTWAAYAEPFGVTGIPHAFIVDAAGILLWHGHPLDGLDGVLEQVVAGTYDATAARQQAEKNAIQDELSELSMLWAQEYLVLSRYGRDKAGADALGKRVLESGYANADFYSQFAWTMLSSQGLAYENLDYMFQVAEFANKLAEGKSADVLDTLAFAMFRKGLKDQAVATQKKAIEICTNEELMTQLKERLARYEQ